ncbi:MAG: hypothetical protein K2G67_00690 [Muribaculaceae bacterium]|nr:hypothetical protein [Muribaculaceae bacterium]
MKKQGSTSEFTEQRNRELHASFLHVLRTERDLPLRQMFGMAALRRCTRFWVSESRAADVIGRMMRGHSLEGMNEKRREMFEEIYRRVIRRMSERPGLCMTHAVGEVILEEAPEFYLSGEAARSIIYRMRQKARAMNRLRRAVSSQKQ